jgi:hypothetical protein
MALLDDLASRESANEELQAQMDEFIVFMNMKFWLALRGTSLTATHPQQSNPSRELAGVEPTHMSSDRDSFYAILLDRTKLLCATYAAYIMVNRLQAWWMFSTPLIPWP